MHIEPAGQTENRRLGFVPGRRSGRFPIERSCPKGTRSSSLRCNLAKRSTGPPVRP